MAQDLVEKAFLAELEALEKFRISYTGLYPNAPLAREDPDVRRLIEAMAMFTARTHVAAQRGLDQSMLRIFRQHFPYMLGPVPAMTMLSGKPTSRYVDVAEVPRGTEVYLMRHVGRDEREETFRFRTLAKLRILPIEIDGVDLIRVRGKGYRILIRFVAAFPRNDDIGELNLHINHLNDLRSSATVLYALKEHLRAASVVYDLRVGEDTQGKPCEAYFGMPESAPYEIDAFQVPLQQARSFLHFPQQELYMNLRGIRPPRNWKHFTLCLDVSDAWPRELRLTSDTFQLHVVPMENVRKDMANPIECDGTKERYSVRHPDEAAHFVPLWVLGVYRMTKQGFVPLEPAVIGVQRESYEFVTEGKDDERKAWITLNLPNAFESPERVAVEVFWHQPLLRGLLASDFRVGLADRYVDGIEWSCSGPLISHGDGELEDDRDGLLQLLSLKNQRFLGTDELVFLLRGFGAHREPYFAKLVTALSGVTVKNKPFAKKAQGFKYIYELTFDSLDTSDLPRLDLLCGRLLEILTAWSVEEVVEIVAQVPNLGKISYYT